MSLLIGKGQAGVDPYTRVQWGQILSSSFYNT